MNRAALAALRDSLRQAVLPTVSPMTVAHLIDALLGEPVDYARDPQPPPPGAAIALSIPFMQAEREADRAATRPVALWETAWRTRISRAGRRRSRGGMRAPGWTPRCRWT